MYAVIDFETTNRAENRRATEVAIAVLDQDFEVLETFESVINPQTAAYRESLGYSRLTQKELDAAPPFEQLWPQVSKLLSGNIMVMHNAEFDRKVLENEFQAMGADSDLPPFVCTLKSAQRSMKGRTKTGGYTLSSLALDLGLAEGDAHQASADVEMTRKLFQHLMVEDRELQVTCEALAEMTVTYPRLMESTPAKPRVRHRAGGKPEAELVKIAYEIAHNNQVLSLKEVCRTGELVDQEKIVARLDEIDFVLQDKETRKGTAFLIQGMKAGKRKIDKALHYGRPVLTEDEALTLVGLLEQEFAE